MKHYHLAILFPLLLIMVLAGCSSKPETGEVTGIVTLDGEPLDEVMVTFLPSPATNPGAGHSWGLTDASGRYTLMSATVADLKGAMLGDHVIVVEDYKAENSHGADGFDIRIPEIYIQAHQTPLSHKVVPGEQEVNLELKSDPSAR